MSDYVSIEVLTHKSAFLKFLSPDKYSHLPIDRVIKDVRRAGGYTTHWVFEP
jgi:hypothetical protein